MNYNIHFNCCIDRLIQTKFVKNQLNSAGNSWNIIIKSSIRNKGYVKIK